MAGAPVAPTPTEEEEDATLSPDEKLAQGVALAPLVEGLRVAGVVTQVDDTAKKARVDLVGRMAEIPFASVTWARLKGKSAPTKMSQVMKPGDIVHVRVLRVTPAPALLDATLDQVPLVQGGLVVIRPTDRHVVALVGGYDFTRSPYNRATQARRQPGSSFKPFIYGAALGSGRFTPITTVNDAPEAIRDPYTGKTWKPQNYDRTFEGPMTLRTALTKSKNTVSVRIIEAITPAAAIDFANRAGIRSPLPENLTLALGTGEVSMLEAANAYATLQANGRYAEPLLLLKVTNAQGKVLEEHQPAFEEKLPPAVAFLTTSLMRSVVEEGTARAVTELNRPAAGKTGTANESRDTWFSGYTADWVASAWVGFDDHSPLGSSETGGRAPCPSGWSSCAPRTRGCPRASSTCPRAWCRCASIPPPACSRATPCPAGSSPSSRAPSPPPRRLRPATPPRPTSSSRKAAGAVSRALAAALLLAAALAAAAEPAPARAALERLALSVAKDVGEARPEAPVALFLSGASPDLRRAWETLLAARLAERGLAPFVLDGPSAEAAEPLARDGEPGPWCGSLWPWKPGSSTHAATWWAPG
ncbi:penicillin-binding transpeptidase domain-containing protein [Cystobacter fuscus]